MLPEEDYFSRALYIFDIGQNDLTTGYKLNLSTEEVKTYVPDVLGQFSNVIKVRKQLSSWMIKVQTSSFSKIKKGSNIFTEVNIVVNSYCTLKEEDHFGYTTQDQWVVCLMLWTDF